MGAYEQAVRNLYRVNAFVPNKMGLDNIRGLHRYLGSPMDGVPCVHIAGTNGKGSVAFKVAAGARRAGLNAGLFVSPHISCFRERVQINGRMIPEEDVIRLLPKILDICQRKSIPATFFELTTALAFCHFGEQRPDMVILEAGLGGRLDATNIVMPMLSIMTSIGLEHTRILGDTIEKIATDKAGIIKPGVPVLVGDSCPHSVIKPIAEGMKSEYFTVSDVIGKVEVDGGRDLVDFDAINTRTARAALTLLAQRPENSVLRENLVETMNAAGSARPPCRFEEFCVGKVPVVLDVGHNPDALSALARKLRSKWPNAVFRFVLGISSDKDAKKCIEKVLELTDPGRIHLVSASHPRAQSVKELEQVIFDLSGCLPPPASDDGNVLWGVKRALGWCNSADDEVLVVTGSVFIMADAREALGVDEPRDAPIIAEVAGSNWKSMQDVMPP